MTSSPTPPADAAAIAALTQQVIASWAAQDAAAFADLFIEDGTMILPGAFAKGREEIRLYMKEAFESKYKNTQVTGRPLDLRFLGDDSAVLITQGGCMAPGESAVAEEQTIRASWVVVKRDGRWWIASYQNSPAYRPLPVPGS
jgi:uncharacterized protein (TIGR02246 family)